jgi:hypothetical protein
LFLNKDVTIQGPGVDLLAIDANGQSRVFNVGSGTKVAFSGLTISGGGNVDEGAGIYASQADVTLDHVRVTGNATRQTTTASNDSGGGIYSVFGSLHIIDSTIDNNAARWNGGIGYYADDDNDTLEIAGSTINNNTAGAYGGLGVLSTTADAPMSVTNTTIAGNTAGDVGGLFVAWDAHLTVVNSTITDNHGSDYGGVFLNESDSVLRLDNTIVAGNHSDSWDGFNRDVGHWLGSV